MTKFSKNCQPLPATFLQVKLGRKKVVATQHGAETQAILGHPINGARVLWASVIGVYKVEFIAGFDAFEQGMGFKNLHCVPANVRDLQGPVRKIELLHHAGNQAQAIAVAFLRVIKHNLAPQADPQHGFAGGEECL